MHSNIFGRINFSHVKMNIKHASSSSGRASYESHDLAYLLHHSVDNLNGNGRWILEHNVNDENQVIAFLNSWAITPYLVNQIVDPDSKVKHWRIRAERKWETDQSLTFECNENSDDDTVYFESDAYFSNSLSGFYIRRYSDHSMTDNMPIIVYTKIRDYINDEQLYLYRYDDTKWLIGHTIGSDCEYIQHIYYFMLLSIF
jgi:hypothetical protein